MNADRQSYGSDWHLPSPSTTPTSATFQPGYLETPKTEVITSSHFFDAFRTPQLNGPPSSTPAQPSFDASFHAVDWPPKGQKSFNLIDPTFHVNHLTSNPHLLLPPVEPSRRLSSSPDLTAVPRERGPSHPNPISVSKALADKVMDSAQMQTPPPTRDATSKRKVQPSTMQFGTPSTIASRKLQNTPAVPPSVSAGGFATFNTPQQFPGLIFSPDNLQFSNVGPATASSVPQSRLFWDNTAAHNVPSDAHITFGDHLFSSSQSFNASSNWLDTANVPSSQGSNYWNDPAAQSHVDLSQSSFVSTTGVDPSMLFSFSNDADTLDMNFVDPYKRHASFNQASYDIQQGRTQPRQQHSRTSTISSASSASSNGRPGLQRSNTDSGVKRPSSMSLSRSSSFNHIPRQASPLKRSSHATLTAIPETKLRPRTRLVIGKDGLARTETDEDARAQSQNIAQRYPELWNDDSDTEPDDDIPISSRNASFTFSTDTVRPIKHARIDNPPKRSSSTTLRRPPSTSSLRNESSRTSRPSSRTLQRQNLSFNNSLNEPRRYSMPAVDALDISTMNDVNDGEGDAQDELERMVKDRITRQQQEQNQAAILRNHNARWADMTRATQPSSSASPSTKSSATDRSSVSNEETRCVCGVSDCDNQRMIQCESCMKWLHIRCLNLNLQKLPPVYICVFCTGNTSVARNGRTREHARPGAQQYASPLGHRNVYRR